MEIEEYRKDYLESVKMSAAADNEGTVATFVSAVLEDLQDLNVVSDFDVCFSTGKYRNKSYRVDAYSFDDYDLSMSLFIAEYQGDESIETITKTEADSLFEKINTFVDGCINGNFRNEIEISTPAYDLVERIVHLKDVIRKFRFFILTDKIMSGRISSFEQGKISGIPIEYNIWDIGRLHRVLSVGDGHEPIEISFSDIQAGGLPCLEASDVSMDDIKCYLCVIPGSVLADLYDKYGSTLLEGNVRSFLSTKVKVNKNIRKTIIEADGEDKRMFFAYNNGVSATAMSAEIADKSGQKYITSIKNLQIVNGGQTTASLSNTRFKDKADLSGIFVQMKLTVIPDHELAQMLIPKISRGSNSQNKVSDADFFSNHEFNVRMQKISRSLYAPAVNGQQYETHWFFERTRGQYAQEMGKMTPGEKKRYQMQNPKEQVITKTDFAKYRNCWRGLPYIVSLGAQKNFTKYADYVVDEWNKDDKRFNEQYFRNTVSIAIMFKYIDRMVSRQDWYEKGYKANIVVYTLSFFRYLVETQFPGHYMNLRFIWEKQGVPETIENEFIRLSELVFRHITAEDRLTANVTEWCKKEQCWVLLKAKDFRLSRKVADYLIDKEGQRKENSDAKKEYALENGIQVQAEVVSKGQEYWERALLWGKQKGILNEVEISFLFSATKMNYGRIPSEKQCQRIVNIEAKLIEEGFK